ncbi:hypothetical protein [Arachidicoccus soli]|uniref:DUF5640 domain-containing protein n=1 Tax=Arachidicoccus soli TaxID=2341117 RepID=A0A386HQS7_9BACT|nr:hypothetical protein [Arachidicoccus soli]AYD48009.1 hypothetical protein D6B99_10665 [Arachidicoccus soli]
MKYLLTAFLLLACIVTNAQNAIDGNWKGSHATPNGIMELNYEFKVQGDTLTGFIKSKFGVVQLENGKVDGKKFSYSISFNGKSIDFTGELVAKDQIITKNERGETKLSRMKE